MRKVVIDGQELMEFDLEEIVPIPAKCTRCGFEYVGNDAIRAPSLESCRCWHCWAKLKPHPDYPKVVDALTRATTPQISLFEGV